MITVDEVRLLLSRTDRRTVAQQMQALGYFNMKYNCPTYAGIVMFGVNPERFMPGCYVQYVRFSGHTRAGEIRSEYKFSGNLVKILSQLDTFVDASITNRRPVPVSALREEIRVDYPHWATRELLMNAICHRDYEGNGPVQFYQYDDRIEIMNPGGLYGKATPENFPYVNDYRNGVIAEGMKVLGFVNRYSRGVQTVQDELRENGNGEADFKLHLGTAFLVIEHISANTSEEPKKGPKKEPKKELKKEPKKEPKKELADVLNLIRENPKITYQGLMAELGIKDSAIYERVRKLKEAGRLRREGGRSGGIWVVID